MSTFSFIRYGLFAIILLLNGLVGTLAALNLGFSMTISGTDEAKIVDIYLIPLSILALLFIFPLLGIEISRKGAVTSRVWFELAWVALFAVLHLGGAIATAIRIPVAFCQGHRNAHFQCSTAQVLLAVAWINACLHLGYFALLFIMSLLTREEMIWHQTVCDYAWFSRTSSSARDNLGGLPTLNKYEASIRSLDSGATLREKGYDYFQHSKQPSYEQPMHRDKSQSNRAERYRLDHHPYHTAGSGKLQSPPSAAKKATPTYYDWNGPEFKNRPFVDDRDVETPTFSPAVISTVQKATIHQPRLSQSRPSPPQHLSLYPQHITNTGLTTKPVPNGAAPVAAVGGRRRGSTGQAQRRLVVTNGTGAQEPAGSISAWERGHAQGSSVDSLTRAAKHRPPPLDLSAVSNIAGVGAGGRRRR